MPTNGAATPEAPPILEQPLPAASNGSRENGIPTSAGKRIPIPIQPAAANGAAAVAPPIAQAASSPAPAAPKFPGTGMLPDVMAYGRPAEVAQPAETVEQQVNRLRPKSVRMQLRFMKTLVFSLWLFGRLIFWQIYVANWFPNLVNSANTRRWRKYARQFRYFAIEMGGVMIKAGQFASTRADIMPEEVIAELVSLQDEVPTVPFKFIEEVLLRELGNLKDRYTVINPQPIAAASLGQVHRAQLNDGTNVVVKIQRPGIREIVYTDMAALFIVAKVAMRFGFVRRRADVVELVDEFGRVLLEEISYVKEAQNADRFRKMYANDSGVSVPYVYLAHSTDFVLTLEDVTTLKINDYEGLAAAGIDRKAVAKRLMDTYMRQIFEDRFFHADPHPGNLFIQPLPVEKPEQYIGKGGRPFRLIFIDFGMTGELSAELVQALINTLTAVITRDSKRLVASYKDLGFLLPGADTKRIEDATEVVFNQVWGMSMMDIRNIDFSAVQNIGREFNDLLYDMPFRVPQDFIYLGRTVGILTGMATALDPDFNPWTEIQENIQKLVTTDKDNNIFEELGAVFTEPLKALFAGDFPAFFGAVQQFFNRFQRQNRVEDMLQKIIDGDIAVVTKLNPQHRRQLERIELQGQRTTRAFIFGSLLITATMFYTNGDMNMALLGYGAAGIALISLLFIRQ
jgi:predicted unusual protein kinase regulating ubiquinone biosynthesis (AarF/ABC1/UbiB family)